MKIFLVVASLMLCLNSARSDDGCGSATDKALAANWFERYKVSWEHRDATAATSLFTKDAEYRDDPFEEPLRGEKRIRQYWDDVAGAQRDVTVSYELLSAHSGSGIVRWRATFVRVSSGQRVELEGIAQFTLNHDSKCSRFLEWWNRKQAS